MKNAPTKLSQIRKARKAICDLEKQQVKIHNDLCKSLDIKPYSQTEGFLFDYLFNGFQYSFSKIKKLIK